MSTLVSDLELPNLVLKLGHTYLTCWSPLRNICKSDALASYFPFDASLHSLHQQRIIRNL